MNRFERKITLLAILGIVVLLSLYSTSIRTFFTSFTSKLHSAYLDMTHTFETVLDNHFFQIETIERLKKDLGKIEKRLLKCEEEAVLYRSIRKSLEITPDKNTTYIVARPEGYAMIGNFQQLWLYRFENYDPMKNYGVIKNGFAIGIVVEKKMRPLMILAGDPQCTFAVYVGESRAPGIAMGVDDRHMVVKYIPQWLKLKPGDEIFTSGLDNIFPPGIPVGRLLYTKKMQGFQNAYIKLYGDTLHPDFVWIVSPATDAKSDS